MIVLTGLIGIGAVRRALPRLHGTPAGEAHFLAGFVRELIDLLRNRSFLLLFGTVLVYFLAYTTSSSLALHACRYFWKLDPFAIQLVLLSTALGPLLGAPISAFLLVGTAIIAAGVGFQSMLADTADEHEWLFGVRREGLFFSGLTLAYKAAAALGGLIAELALDAIQFPTDLVSKGSALVVPNEVLAKLGLIAGPLPAAFAAIAPLFPLGYHLTRKKHAQIIVALEQRHAKRAD